jgi:hypothetical protein
MTMYENHVVNKVQNEGLHQAWEKINFSVRLQDGLWLKKRVHFRGLDCDTAKSDVAKHEAMISGEKLLQMINNCIGPVKVVEYS